MSEAGHFMIVLYTHGPFIVRISKSWVSPFLGLGRVKNPKFRDFGKSHVAKVATVGFLS